MALQLLALCAFVIALARPHGVITLPTLSRTVVLAVDTSGSMRATDLTPTRLVAARNVIRDFVESAPGNTRFALVSFAGTAALVQPPTSLRDTLLAALERLEPQRGTALGSAIGVALSTLLPHASIDLQRLDPSLTASTSSRPDRPSNPPPQARSGDLPATDESSGVIVLLSDGQSTTGPDPIVAARLAATHGVRIYTVGLGTAQGEVLRSEGLSMRVGLDEATLKGIAGTTGGEYFPAPTAKALSRVYQSINARIGRVAQRTELSALFAGSGVALALLGAGLSLHRRGRIV